jgi:D-alanyl-D-alanine carboxypeptidase (penicillin-binding protein 5/6)
MPRHRRAKHGPSHGKVVFGGVVLGLVLGGALVAAAAVPLPTGPPTMSLHIAAKPSKMAPLDLPFPAQGESAVAIPTLDVSLTPGDQQPVPIASLTKMMTAYVTFRDLPLGPEDQGPSIYVTSADVKEYKADLRGGESCVLVAAGEVLTERELLDGMLVHSANNFATLLARMVAGDESAMVTQMNDEALALGLHQTTYADVTGVDPASRSNAADQLHLAVLLMRNATFAAIVRQTSVVLPIAGVVTTFMPDLGRPGVVGIKTGTTSESKGCVLMAYDAAVAGRPVQVIVAVLGQSSPNQTLLEAAGKSALILATGTARRIRPWRVVAVSEPVGSIGWPSKAVPIVVLNSITVPTFPGVAARSTVEERTWAPNYVADRQHLATVFVTSGAYRYATPIVTSAQLTRATLWQRLR